MEHPIIRFRCPFEVLYKAIGSVYRYVYIQPMHWYIMEQNKEMKKMENKEIWTKIIDPRDPALIRPNSRARYEHPAYGGAVTPTPPEGCHMWADYANDRWIAQEVE